MLWSEEAESGISLCVHGAGLKFGQACGVDALYLEIFTKIQNMAEMSWVEQLRQYNARHEKNKAGELS